MNFRNPYRHGFARVAACSPPVSIADPDANLAAILAAAGAAEARGAVLALFPELSLSGYAIDDLLQQDALHDAVEAAVAALLDASRTLRPILVAGAPVRHEGRLYNAAAVAHRGRLLGVVPKSYLPNYREFHEARHFAPGAGIAGATICLGGQQAPFGTDLLFAAEDLPGFCLGVEICEDLWIPSPPSGYAAMAGATILANLSASPATIGRDDARRDLCRSQSLRCLAGYLYTAAGPGESTTDLAWDGQACIFEHGVALAEGPRFHAGGAMAVADLDLDLLRQERARMGTFGDAARHHAGTRPPWRRIGLCLDPPQDARGLERPLARFPFVPADPARLARDCGEAYAIQVAGLAQRLSATGAERVAIGISGGLDSTQALLVCAKAMDRLGRGRDAILAVTMPGFGTGDPSRDRAHALMRALGVSARELDIRPMATQMLRELDHPFARGEPVHDLTFENVQAGLRTDFLFRLAGQQGALVVGTGDLSELALGWCTFGVGDHMAHYNANAGLPKTLIQHLIRWTAREGGFDPDTARLLDAIVAAEISPELVPAGEGGAGQSTEAAIGPYELQDFNLYHLLRYGFRPSKIAFLALQAWEDAGRGTWPPNFPAGSRRAYGLEEIREWLALFLRRFAASQFKRSTLPNGPKIVAGGSLSPRGDWRAPSDGNARAWLRELEAGTRDGE